MDESTELGGKSILLTGATSGIGLASARALHRRGASLTLVGRNAEKLVEVRRALGSVRIEILQADLSRVAEVDRLADVVLDRHQRLDVLLNNAGVMSTRRMVTPDGFEQTFATNHLAYFHLTNRLVPLLTASAPARIVSVASDAHHWAKSLELGNLQGDRKFSGMVAYAESKLMNILFTRELARRLEGSGVTANCLHPGVVRTGIFPGGPVGRFLIGLVCIAPDRGAETSVYLCSSTEVERVSGGYFNKCREAEPSALARDDHLAARLWQESERLIRTVLEPGGVPNQ